MTLISTLSGNIFFSLQPHLLLNVNHNSFRSFFYYGIQYYSFSSHKQFVIVLYAQATYRTHTHKHRVLSLVYSSSSSVPYLSAFFLWLFAATGGLFFRLYFPLFLFRLAWLSLVLHGLFLFFLSIVSFSFFFFGFS